MYCSSCGKQNPEGAAFCAFCGKKMAVPEADSQAFIEGELLAPEQEGQQVPPVSHQPYMRPDPSRLVTPIADNPAQPARRSEMRKARSAQADQPIAQEREEREAHAKPQSAAEDLGREETGQKGAAPQREGPVHKSGVSREENRVQGRSAPQREGAKPLLEVLAAGRLPVGQPGGTPWDEPCRNGKHRYLAGKKTGWEAPSTLVPKRRKRPEDDLFFGGRGTGG